MNFSPNDVERLNGHNLAVTFSGGYALVVDNTPADAQSTCVRFDAPSGNYDMTFRFLTDPTAGIVETRVDGVLIDTFDAYDPVGGTIAVRSIANVPIVSGEHVVTFTINGKNAASTNFFCWHAWSHIEPR